MINVKACCSGEIATMASFLSTKKKTAHQIASSLNSLKGTLLMKSPCSFNVRAVFDRQG